MLASRVGSGVRNGEAGMGEVLLRGVSRTGLNRQGRAGRQRGVERGLIAGVRGCPMGGLAKTLAACGGGGRFSKVAGVATEMQATDGEGPSVSPILVQQARAEIARMVWLLRHEWHLG